METENTTFTEETIPENETPETETPEAPEEETAAPMEPETAPTEAETAPDETEIPLSITVDDGLKRIPVRNKAGQQIGVFAFRPTDFDMIARFNEMVRRWDGEVTKTLEALGDNPDIDDPKVGEVMRVAKEKLFKLCDYAFGGNMSEAFFGSMNPFSPVDGGLYCENALNAVSEFLTSQFNRETAKIRKRVKKYMPTTRDHLRKGGKRRG